MKNFLLLCSFFLIGYVSFSQTKVSGVVLDIKKQPISYANRSEERRVGKEC